MGAKFANSTGELQFEKKGQQKNYIERIVVFYVMSSLSAIKNVSVFDIFYLVLIVANVSRSSIYKVRYIFLKGGG
jgi:hypothetical protein